MRISHEEFRHMCRKHNLAATHQRQIIFQAVVAKHGHYSPEEVYESVRHEIPSISLATVYKNLHTFVQSGMLREVSPHHGSLRVDPRLEPHHHLVCMVCKSIFDIDSDALGPIKLQGRLPQGFRAERMSVDILGTCSRCSSKTTRH
jgi:Fur family transcriptional regulator, peroxide stress response regulator